MRIVVPHLTSDCGSKPRRNFTCLVTKISRTLILWSLKTWALCNKVISSQGLCDPIDYHGKLERKEHRSKMEAYYRNVKLYLQPYEVLKNAPNKEKMHYFSINKPTVFDCSFKILLYLPDNWRESVYHCQSQLQRTIALGQQAFVNFPSVLRSSVNLSSVHYATSFIIQ